MIESLLLDDFNDVSKLYKKLKSLHQDQYPSDYQLQITYTQDNINNDNYPGVMLTNLVRILTELDIPAFFVTVLSNYGNISRDLGQLNGIYKNGTIKHIPISGTFNVLKNKKDTFCILPWMHFYFNPQGQINPCCDADINYPLGDYRNGDIDFNSANIINFRQTLLNGEEAPQCSSCYKKEQNGVVSLRQQFNQIFNQYRLPFLNENVDNFQLKYLDVRLSNLCNLKCRMCSGKFSSKIADEDYRIWGSTEFLNNSNSTKHENKIVDIILKNINSIEHVYFAGGEPLINDTHYKILDILLENKKFDANISYNTNFSTVIHKKYNVFEYWKKFNSVTVGASIDLIGPSSDYVRNGVDYQTLENNYFLLKAQCPDVKFNITSVLSLYNVFNLCQLQRHWINQIGLTPAQFNITNLISPDHLSVSVLPSVFKQQAVNTINNHIKYLNSVNATNLVQQWESAIEYMLSQDNSYLLPKFFELGDQRDQYRKQKFEDYFPEFQLLRNYI
jgi:hypothetical protein